MNSKKKFIYKYIRQYHCNNASDKHTNTKSPSDRKNYVKSILSG